jgi:hypothetical protein
MVEEHPKNLSLLTSPRSVLFVKKQNTTTNNGCNTYYYGERIGMIMWSMYTWHGKYDAMQLILIKRNRNPDTHIYGSSCFTTQQFKCWLAWQRKGMGELHKIKWSGETIIGNSQLLHMFLLDDMQTTTSRHDARCKQGYGWHIQILCIFLINFHIKYFLFRVTV